VAAVLRAAKTARLRIVQTPFPVTAKIGAKAAFF